jgi:hypothetical protein
MQINTASIDIILCRACTDWQSERTNADLYTTSETYDHQNLMKDKYQCKFLTMSLNVSYTRINNSETPETTILHFK